MKTIRDKITDRVSDTFDALVKVADLHNGFFPSVIDCQTLTIPKKMPPAIPGQREGDRARWGCNLMHDHPLLRVMLLVGQEESYAAYVGTVERYLSQFVTHCTHSPSGLFLWGEHAYWRIDTGRAGNSMADASGDPSYPIIHDHLRAAPLWLWRKLDDLNPECVQRFAHGLDYHFKIGEPDEYSRHTCLEAGGTSLSLHHGFDATGRPKRLHGRRDGANDFPRHSGFYAIDLAFAWSRSCDANVERKLQRATDYWWLRHDDLGPLPLQSRGDDAPRLVSQTLSLAYSLLEVAEVLESAQSPDHAWADRLRQRARRYIDLCYVDRSPSPNDLDLLRDPNRPAWGSSYGHTRPVISRYPLLYLGGYRLTGDDRLLRDAITLTQRLAEAGLPSDVHVLAIDVAMGLGAMADLYELTREARWMDHALALADQTMQAFWIGQNRLPLGASGIDWYEAQMGTGYLLYHLARVAYLARSIDACPISSDYTNR